MRFFEIMAVILVFHYATAKLSQVSDATTQEENKTKVVKAQPLPYLYLVEPFARNGSVSTNRTEYPCAGIPKDKTHLLSSPGALSIIQWRTVVSAGNGSCRIRISNGIDTEDSFEVLQPRDKSANSAGWFQCGLISNKYETKEIAFPKNLSCDKCTLQLTWKTSEFTHYHCTDVTLMSDEVKQCMGKCQNRGSCVNGRCVCLDGYYGNYCENKLKVETEIGWMWLVYVVLVLLIAGLLVAAYLIKKSMDEKSSPDPVVQSLDGDKEENKYDLMNPEPEVKEEKFEKSVNQANWGREVTPDIGTLNEPTPNIEHKEDLMANHQSENDLLE